MSISSDQVSLSPKQLWWFLSQYSPAGTPAGDGIMPKNSPIKIQIVSPMLKAVSNMHSYLEEIVGDDHTKVDPQDAWLPITESRNGNKYYAAFHTLSSGIGFQALLLPFAFTSLGWIWGITCLILGFTWQMYTIWLLIQLHESENGIRYSRYLRLSMAAFGEKLGKLLSLFPIMYLSGGTCVALVMFGSGSLKNFYQTLCGPTSNPLTTVEWYMVFTSCAVLMAQLPNLNSLAFVSLIGSVSGVGYCCLIWVLSVCKDRPTNVSYGSTRAESEVFRVCEVVNAIGIIGLAFRGHNLVLEIQGTMPSNIKEPSKIGMWQGVKFAYVIIGMCLFPIAIAGYWAYGNLIIPTTNEGILEIMYKYHSHNTSKFVLCLTSLLVVIHCLSSFQVYAMPVFDNLEFRYTSCKERPCPRWLRSVIRAFFGCLTVFIAFALPFLPKLAGLLGGIAMPITYVYPCFMWIKMKKPQQLSLMWWLNWALGCVGILASVLVVTGAIWYIVIQGIPVHFFKPQ